MNLRSVPLPPRWIPVQLAVACTALGAGAATSDAAVYCVPSTAVAADCTAASPTPQDAVALAANQTLSPGADTVRLAAGTYTAPVSAVGSAAPTTIIGAGQSQTIFEGAPGTDLVALSGDFRLQDVTVRVTGGNGNAIDLASGSLERVTVERTGTGSGNVLQISGSGPDQVGARDVTVTTTTANDYPVYLFNTGVVGLDVTSLHDGSYTVFGASFRMQRSTIRSGAGNAAVYAQGTTLIESSVIQAGGTAPWGIFAISGGANVDVSVRDSTVINRGTAGVAALAAQDYVAGRVVNVAASGIASTGFAALGCAGTSDVGRTATITVAHSVAPSATVGLCPAVGGLTNTGTTTPTAGPGLVSATPAFVNLAGGDLRPVPGGNLIDAGDPATPVAPLGVLDRAGAVRVVDGNADGIARRDAGAFEWQLPVPETPTVPETPADPGSTTPPAAPPAPTAPGSGAGPGTPPVVTPKALVTGLKFRGTLRRSKKAAKRPFVVETRAPKRKSVPLLTIRLDAPSTLTFSLSRKVGKRYKPLAGTATADAKSKTLLLRPTGSWNGKRLKRGSYRLEVVTSPGAPAKTIKFKVVS